MNRISLKRKATARLMHNSTFSVQEGRKLLSGQLPQKAKDERAKAKARAWKWFSMFIRLRDSLADGYGKCITCPRSAHWSTMDAGHYITRAKEATLFDERNVHLQCKGCNRFQGGKFLEHGQAIDRKYGHGTKAAIELKAVQVCKRTTQDYQFIEATYRKRVEWIKQNEPSKFKLKQP